MPRYDYRCEDCGYTEEVFHHIDSHYAEICPQCNKGMMVRLLSSVPHVWTKNNIKIRNGVPE